MKERFNTEKCQKEIFGPAHHSSGGPAHQVVKNEDTTPLFFGKGEFTYDFVWKPQKLVD